MSAESRTFSSRTVTILAAIAVVSFLLAFVMAAFGDDLADPSTAEANTFSKSAVGHHALKTVLEQAGFEVTIRRSDRATSFGPGNPLLLLEPHTALFEDTDPWSELVDRANARDAPVLIALPKWSVMSDPAKTSVATAARIPIGRIESALEAFYGGTTDELEVPQVTRSSGRARRLDCRGTDGNEWTATITKPQLFEPGDGLDPILECDDGILAARVPVDGPPILLVSDPDLFNSQGLGRNALIVHSLLVDTLDARGVVIDETVHGFAINDGLISELLRFPLVLVVLHGLLLVGLTVWMGIGRFGNPDPRPTRLSEGKRLLIDNAAGLLDIGGHSSDSLQRYFEYNLRAVGRHYFFAPDTPLGELETRLQLVSRQRGIEVDLNKLRKRFHEAAAEKVSRDRAVRLAGRLFRWRQEMIDGSRSR